jgi:hypothetical protein
MPNTLRRAFSRRRWRLRASRIRRHPLGRLVQHFLARLVHGGQEDGSDFELGAGALLGLLAAPAAFESFLELNKYSTLLDWLRKMPPRDYYVTSAPDKYLFICIAMAITGIMTVLKWDRILPDAQDYLNLAPQPIRPRTVLLANVAAIAIAVLIFAVDVNAIPTLLFPAFVTAAAGTDLPALAAFIAIHGGVITLAILFTFCSVFALLGTLAAVLPRTVFQTVSSWVRGFMLVAFLALLPTGYAASRLLRELGRAPDSLLGWLPSFWFLGLYQSLQHRATPVLSHLASRVLPGLAAAFALMAIAYALGYRRRFAAVLESGRSRGGRWNPEFLPAFLDLFARSRSGFERACHMFMVRALLRNEAQRLCLAVGLGLGWLMALQNIVEAPPVRGPSLPLLEAPLTVAYLLILAIRLALEIPATLPANWIYRATLDARENETRGVVRRLILAFLAPGAILPFLLYFWWRCGWLGALLETAYLTGVSLCAIEILLAGYRKVPLTCPLPGIRQNFLMLCLIQFLGFAAFTRIGAEIEDWMFDRPERFIWLPLVMAGAWLWQQRRLRLAREAGEWDEGMTFESAPPPEVERLNILSGG